MRKPFAAALALLATAAVADEGVKTQQVIVQPLDTMKACYLKNDVYSEGMVITVGNVKMKCLRGEGQFGRSSAQPLEWVEIE